MRELAEQPRPPGAEKLSGHDLYRVRQGNYRILYEIVDHDLTVTVIKFGHRREVYR
jgi:mRNA interferase RelE/StbE